MSFQTGAETGGVIRRTIVAIGFVLTALVPLDAQKASPPAEQQGVAAEWEVRNQLTALADGVRQMEPLLQRVDPVILQDNGAPEAYIQQLRSAQAAMKALLTASEQLAQRPEKLPTALDVYFQMERMELLLNSLRDGIRKYQSPDLASMLSQAFAKNAVHRDRLRQHIRDVTEAREQEFQIANEEAQRCRGTLTKQPVTATKQPGPAVEQKQPAASSSNLPNQNSQPQRRNPLPPSRK